MKIVFTGFLQAVREIYRERGRYTDAMKRVDAVSATEAVIALIRAEAGRDGKR